MAYSIIRKKKRNKLKIARTHKENVYCKFCSVKTYINLTTRTTKNLIFLIKLISVNDMFWPFVH